ncbi:hypothetical protein V1478_002326 [Vespula squamosa]|uniref:Uncharacterized protein n=1 Tax=Vespula squamosa TaxID=30214 RepID=A0ABD2BVZ0_VESSQ
MIPRGGSCPLTRGNDDDARTTTDTQVTDNAEANGTDTERQLVLKCQAYSINSSIDISKRLTTSVRCEQGFRCVTTTLQLFVASQRNSRLKFKRNCRVTTRAYLRQDANLSLGVPVHRGGANNGYEKNGS